MFLVTFFAQLSYMYEEELGRLKNFFNAYFICKHILCLWMLGCVDQVDAKKKKTDDLSFLLSMALYYHIINIFMHCKHIGHPCFVL